MCTLDAISAAALRVKVMLSISSGSLTVASRPKIRCVISPVFPEPAGAETIKLSRGSIALNLSAWSTTAFIGSPAQSRQGR